MIRVLLLLLSTAWADNSIGAGGHRCTMDDSPFLKLSRQFQKRGFSFRDARATYRLYSTSDPPSGSLLQFSSGETLAMIAGPTDTQLVVDEANHLRGIFSVGAPPSLYAGHGHRLWKNEAVSLRGDSAATLVAGDLLVVAVFHRIATGAELLAFDLATGKLRWRANVVQLQVGHSEYYNDVTLERAGTTVIMRGYEAAGCYRQEFDLATGRRLSAQMPRSL